MHSAQVALLKEAAQVQPDAKRSQCCLAPRSPCRQRCCIKSQCLCPQVSFDPEQVSRAQLIDSIEVAGFDASLSEEPAGNTIVSLAAAIAVHAGPCSCCAPLASS